MSSLIIEGNCVTPEGVIKQQIEVNPSANIITHVSSHITDEPDLTLTENDLIFPGFIDIHIHAREDSSGNHNYKEDFRSMSEASLNGGLVAVMDMPNNFDPPVDLASWRRKKTLIEQRCFVETVPFVGIGKDTYPIHEAVVPYKAYMGPSIGELFFETKEQLFEVMARYEEKTVSFHCEDPEILQCYKDGETHQERRPHESEIEAVKTAIELTRKYHLHTVVCHLSTKRGLELCLDAQKEGLDVKVEVAPHHLYFSVENCDKDFLKMLQVNPPIRNEEDRLFLLENLKKGKIDFLATDHAPHSLEEKERGMSGITGLDTFGLIVGDLIDHHNVSPVTMLKMASLNPGNHINPFSSKKFGRLEVGYCGQLAIIKGNKEHKLKKEDLKTKNQWSPFIEKHFTTNVEVWPKLY